jgi:predicted ester cyclase
MFRQLRITGLKKHKQVSAMKKINNKTIVRQYVEQIENTGDVTHIKKFISEDYTEVYEGKRYNVGIKGAIQHILGVRRVFPDLVLKIKHQVSEGEWVATTYSVTGTFQEEWMGIKPTGKSITFSGVNVDRIRDGKIIEHGGAANLLDPLLKAGAIKKNKTTGNGSSKVQSNS